MSFQSAIPWQGALQPEPASASPTANDSQQPMLPYNDFAANGNNPLNSVSQLKGALHISPSLASPPRKKEPDALCRPAQPGHALWPKDGEVIQGLTPVGHRH